MREAADDGNVRYRVQNLCAEGLLVSVVHFDGEDNAEMRAMGRDCRVASLLAMTDGAHSDLRGVNVGGHAGRLLANVAAPV
jgi:hypothetical protein